GYVSKLWDFTRISLTQNNLQELKEIWGQCDNEINELFYCHYGDLPYLLDIKVDEHLFRALAQYWNSAYSCFTFRKADLVPTIEEYTVLLRCPKIQTDRVYSRAANKRVDVFALSIYDLVVFPKALGYIDKAVFDLFDRLDKRVTPVPVILAETFRSLNKIEKVSYRVFSKNYSPLKELVAKPRRDDILKEKRMAILQNLQDEDYRLRQFIPATQGLAQCEFSYKDDNYKKKVQERVNDNILVPNQEITRSLEEHLQVIPFELEIIKQDFEKRNLELGNKIEQLEEEKMQLGLDVDVQKLEVDKLRKGKNKAEEDLDSLKTDYKNLHTRAQEDALEKSLLELQNEKAGLRAQVTALEKLLHQYRSHNSAIELRTRLNKIEKLKGKIGELEDAL
ncbi:hypothetical protein Golax_025726, partial [Gossypium laxum]|nr:hypothetical protein [Gossypium laxum]